MWWRFFDTIDRAVNLTPWGLRMSRLSGDNRDFNTKKKTGDFYVKIQLEKNHKEGESSLFSESYNIFCRVVLCLQSLVFDPFS